MRQVKTIYKFKKYFESVNKRALYLAILLLLVCLIHAWSAGRYANFSPINGTFQNYNPVRRLLAGQIPYRDFQDYLGIGHLYIGSLMTVIFGGSYNDSLIAFSFLSILGCAMILAAVGLAFDLPRESIFATVIIILVLSLVQAPLIATIVGYEEVKQALYSGVFGPGNSARFIRGMILPLSCFLLMGMKDTGLKAIENCKSEVNSKEIALVLKTGMIAAFAFIWSNDYGISCWLCLLIMSCWFAVSKERKLRKALLFTVFETAVSLVFIVILIEILTLGHFSGWLKATFGTGGYQSWYYNSAKSFYLFDIDFSFIMGLQAFLCLYYLYKVFTLHASEESIRRYGILAYVNMSGFCAANEYKMLSGEYSREVALTILFATFFFEIIGVIKSSRIFRGGGAKVEVLVAVILGVTWCVSDLKEELTYKLEDKQGVYIAELGGKVTEFGEDLIITDEFLDGSRVFATYASGQEVVSGEFQPSGIDYIIHVLGDETRKKYLDAYLDGNFTYVATIRKEFSLYEYWAERANWFFYRELYNQYHPVFFNSYELYWAENEEDELYTIENRFAVEVVDIDSSTKKLILRTGEEVNGIADIYLDYKVEKTDSFLSKLIFSRMLYVQNTGKCHASDSWFESNYLREAGTEYIPMAIENGYGELTLTSQPLNDTYLKIYNVGCDRIFTVLNGYIGEAENE